MGINEMSNGKEAYRVEVVEVVRPKKILVTGHLPGPNTLNRMTTK